MRNHGIYGGAEMRNPVVYVVQDHPKFDVTPALVFGELKVIYSGPFIRWENQFVAARKALINFNSEVDYLLCIGDPVHMFLVGSALAKAGHLTIKILRWSMHRQMYDVVSVSLSSLPSIAHPV